MPATNVISFFDAGRRRIAKEIAAIEPCYGKHGKGYAHTPPRHSDLELVLMNENRQLWYTPGRFEDGHAYLTDAVTNDSGWRILGWRMADGSMPLGDYDEVDPELAQIDYLPAPNPPLEHGPSVMCHPRGSLYGPPLPEPTKSARIAIGEWMATTLS
jgi:hypothetical protein